MSNYTQNNFPRLNILINEEDYWDFVVNHDSLGSYDFKGLELYDNCLAAYIDTDLPECVSGRALTSTSAFTYSEACSQGLDLENFGLTSMDNGYTLFQRDEVTNKEFYDLYTKTHYVLDADDLRVHLYAVSGNTDRYEYPMSINEDGTIKLNGGFYQGFFHHKNDYMVLPSQLRSGDIWNLEFVLRPRDYEPESDKTLNDQYPENKGIFFYIGTRAENKWIYLYDNKLSGETSIEQDGVYDTLDCDLIEDDDEYLDEDIIEPEIPIDDFTFETSNGFKLDSANDEYVISDNKFLMFDRTCSGLTADNAQGNEEVMLTWKKGFSWERLLSYLHQIPSGYTTGDVYVDTEWKNSFLFFNRSCTGLTAPDAEALYTDDWAFDNYDAFYKDIYENALAFVINEDGSVGYRYLIKDCDAPNEGHYAVISGSSYSGMVQMDEWVKINVKIKSSEHVMKLYFYVNDKLKYITKELPKLNLHDLEELDEKEEGVPFNISIGGGTQGLAETILPHYMLNPTEVYPLESHFGGTFIGDFKSFKFYTCQ